MATSDPFGKGNEIVVMVHNQNEFDDLFEGLYHSDRKVVMRTADAIEKITSDKPDCLQKHRKELLNLCQRATNIELKWHLVLLVSRLKLTRKELKGVWALFTQRATDRNENKIVRVNSNQGLFNMLPQGPELSREFGLILDAIENEKVPSLNARIGKLRKLPDNKRNRSSDIVRMYPLSVVDSLIIA